MKGIQLIKIFVHHVVLAGVPTLWIKRMHGRCIQGELNLMGGVLD